MGSSVVDRAIARALQDAEAELRRRDVRAVTHLDSHEELDTARQTLYEAVYAVFRALPARLAPGSVLEVRTSDRPGGDIELVWNVRETAPAPPMSRTSDVLRNGPYGDLFGLALVGLERICRTRAEHLQVPEPGPGGQLYHRRFMLLVPSLTRVPGWYP